MRRLLPPALAAIVALGCASDGPDVFPSDDELSRLAELPAQDPTLLRDALVLDTWQLRGPLPDRVEARPVALTEPGEEAIDDLVASGAPVVATASMRCFARQMAELRLRHPASGLGPQLRTFATARCGVGEGSPGWLWLEDDVLDHVSDAQLLEVWDGPIREAVQGALSGSGEVFAGAALARGEGRAVWVLARTQHRVELAGADLVLPPDGRLVLAGSVRETMTDLEANVGIGELRSLPCEPVPGVVAPAFRFTCPADPGDGWNWVTLHGRHPDRVLSERLLVLVVREPGDEARTFRRVFHTAAHRLGPNERLAEAFTDQINRVRARTGAPPLRISDRQSAVAGQLAPHFFASTQGSRDAPDGTSAERVQDLVVLGMIAGWNVDGIVGQGGFASAWAPATSDVAALVSSALQLPGGRATLLDPEAEAIALGTLRDDGGGGLASIFGTYAFLEQESFHAQAGTLFQRLTQERAERGLEAPRELRGLDTLAMQAAERVRRGADPDEAMDQLLAQSVEHLRLGVQGFFQEAGSPEDSPFPEALLAEPRVGVAIGVSVHRPSDYPWGRYVIFFVTAKLGGWYR